MSTMCKDAAEKLYRYLDGEIGRYARWRIQRHLRRCPPCTDGYAFESALKEKIRRDCADELPEELWNRLRTFLRQNGTTDMSAGPTAGGSDV